MARKKAKSEAKSEAPKKIKPISLNILEIAKRLQKLEQTSGGGDHSALANKSDIATDFNTTTAYTAGCFVYHDGKLYQFNADHAAGAWDPTDVVEANVTDQVVSNKAAIDGLTASDVAYDNTDSGLTADTVQGAIDELRQADNIMMSDGTTSVEDKVDELTDYVVDTTTISGVKITKMGHIVMLAIDKTITMQGSQWVNLGAVPYKPTTEIFGVAKQDAVDKIISIDLPVNGNLAVMGSGSDSILVRGSLTYLTND